MRREIGRAFKVLACIAGVQLGVGLNAVAAPSAAPASAGAPRISPVAPGVQEATICRDTIAYAERLTGIPTHLMQSVAIAESGRYDAGHKAVLAWPWTINAEGEGKYLPSKAAAIAEVRRLQAQGVRSIDVGCMQINLIHHASAFADLEHAFDPGYNIAYGAKFLRERFDATRSWATAVAHYHSQNPEHGEPYRDRVLAIWQKEMQGGPTAVAALYRGAPTAAPTRAVAMVPQNLRWFPAHPDKAIAQIQIIQGNSVTTIPVTGPKVVRPTIIAAGNNRPVVWATPNVRVIASR